MDNDGDGVTNETDCDDNDAAIYPGAIEICDEKDNNCDGAIDEGLAVITYFLDADSDGYGNPSTVIESCQNTFNGAVINGCLLYTSPSPRDKRQSRMPSSA